ncbi:UPF0149 family protein [Nitrogeniibacter mangrovi]|uniref:UPF0149 family protein n=1 Tax=Nitrogeniibacter mangrovi TaxID=2016596 RepID=A0A6C1BBN8_9RHOO|nr:UPF0149 family protein [Nitrogeniibacter mangrovi]QID19820.1 UPF0149 family protein [Nitrogeniibacter mangrovi]
MVDMDDADVSLSEAELDELESLLASDAVPDDCMSLEMLDGYLAAVTVSPRPLETVEWLPSVWSDTEALPTGGGVQRLLTLILRYHDEIAQTLGDPDGWEPFCYASDETADEVRLGDEWMTGFELGLELWDEDWREDLEAHDADTFEDLIEKAMTPWTAEDMEQADDETRIEWLTATAATVRAIHHLRDACGLPPVPAAAQAIAIATAAPVGRNDPCPCGSGRKYKACCGADA